MNGFDVENEGEGKATPENNFNNKQFSQYISNFDLVTLSYYNILDIFDGSGYSPPVLKTTFQLILY